MLSFVYLPAIIYFYYRYDVILTSEYYAETADCQSVCRLGVAFHLYDVPVRQSPYRGFNAPKRPIILTVQKLLGLLRVYYIHAYFLP